MSLKCLDPFYYSLSLSTLSLLFGFYTLGKVFLLFVSSRGVITWGVGVVMSTVPGFGWNVFLFYTFLCSTQLSSVFS